VEKNKKKTQEQPRVAMREKKWKNVPSWCQRLQLLHFHFFLHRAKNCVCVCVCVCVCGCMYACMHVHMCKYMCKVCVCARRAPVRLPILCVRVHVTYTT
jgi:hypothetical protein